jgi:hypothetical protein
MNLPTAEASNAVVIAKNPAKGQFMVDDIPLAVILTGDPLNNYPNGGFRLVVLNTPNSHSADWGRNGAACPPFVGIPV